MAARHHCHLLRGECPLRAGNDLGVSVRFLCAQRPLGFILVLPGTWGTGMGEQVKGQLQ